jgi:hypothetical protein
MAGGGTRVIAQRHAPGRREAVLGGCGKRVLRFTPRPMPLRDHVFLEECSSEFHCKPAIKKMNWSE